MSELNYYEYRVTFIGDYWDFSIRVQICLDENTGNTSDEAREKAITEAMEKEWVAELVAMSDDTKVVLMLGGEDIEIDE